MFAESKIVDMCLQEFREGNSRKHILEACDVLISLLKGGNLDVQTYILHLL